MSGQAVSFPASMDVNCLKGSSCDAGQTIRGFASNPSQMLKPLGYSPFDPGFGSMFVTYRNCPNNCPLALWYGESGVHAPRYISLLADGIRCFLVKPMIHRRGHNDRLQLAATKTKTSCGRITVLTLLFSSKLKKNMVALSNMAGGFPLVVNDIRIRTSEALYQACRFPHMPDVQQLDYRAEKPNDSKDEGQTLSTKLSS